MFKLLFIILKVIIVAVVIVAGYFFFQTKVASADNVNFGFFSVKHDDGGYYVKIKDEDKPILKKIAQKINSIIYEEATIHNPEGDMLPDAIDDVLKEQIKERVN